MNAESTSRQVVDWDGRPVGWIREQVLNPRTGTVRSLLVQLGPEARARLDTPEHTMAIPASKVVTMRRDEVALGVRMRELGRPPHRLVAPPRRLAPLP